ncbi:MAG: sulfotransferase, partial [Proteobacteria bacterium]|nr:sulfotransferase [Pseudomonadota bacterium]
RRARPLYHYKLGQALQAAGRPDEAAEAFASSIRLKPDLWPAHVALGAIHQRRGDRGEAAVHLKRGRRLALAGSIERAALAPRRLGVWGLVLARYGHLGRKTMVSQAQCRLGRIYQGRGKLDAAKAAYRRALNANPDCIEALNALGEVLSGERAYDAAADHLEKARALEPDNPETLAVLAPVLAWLSRHDEAVSLAETCLVLGPDRPRSHCAMGWALHLKGDSAGAVPHFEKALAIDSRLVEGYLGLGTTLQSLGKLDEAVEQFRKCLSIEPSNGEALWYLSRNLKLGTEDPEPAQLEQALTRTRLSTTERMTLNFAAGKMYDDSDAVDKAFEHYKLANDLMDAEFDPQDWVAQVTALIEICDAGFFEKSEGYGVSSELPVFIVGMPRSGTTLIEQILASHPDVFGAGELNQIRAGTKRLPASLGTEEAYPDCLPKVDKDTVRSLAAEYLETLRGLSPDAARITDKMPGNFLHLGFIALLFPQARVIHCLRDPLDVCVSNYVTRFTAGLPYTFDLTNLGLYYRQYERLMGHWRHVLPIPMLEVRYEDLIADQAGVSRQLIDFCGLAWDDRCLAFHKTERAVLTASYQQVRQPIYSNSIGRWRRYEKHLGPLKSALGSSVLES